MGPQAIKRRLGGALGFVAALAISASFQAQTQAQNLRLPGDADTSRIRPPTLPLPSTPSFDLRIESPERSAIPKAVDEIDFDVKAIRVDGVTAYSLEEVNTIFEPLQGKRITLDALRQATEALENLYRRDGYFLVRVLIPPQRVADGTFRVQVIEGYIENAFTQGGTSAAQSRVQVIIQKVVGKKPIDLQSLERVLLLLNDLPGVSGTGVLRQGQGLGGSELVVTLNDLPPTGLSVNFNNSASRVMGIYGLSLNANFNNPLEGSLGQASLGYSSALSNERLNALSARYALPLGDQGMVLSFSALQALAKPAGALRDLALQSKSTSIAPRLRYPLQRGREQSVYLETGLALNASRTTLLTSEITKDKTAVIDLAASLSRERFLGGQAQGTFSLAHGLDAFNAYGSNAQNPSTPGFKQRFLKLGLLANLNYRLHPSASLAFTLQAQETQDKLLSGEQIAFGGAMIGRGYDGGAISGDRGYGALAELQYRVPESVLAIPGVANLTAFAFVDYAKAFTLQKASVGTASETAILGSHGLGLRMSHTRGLTMEFMLAEAHQALDPIDPRENTQIERALGFLNSKTRFLFSLTQSF